jgi:hypothetical protein
MPLIVGTAVLAYRVAQSLSPRALPKCFYDKGFDD